MIASHLTLQKPLEDYIELFEKATARSLSLFDPLLDEGFIFEDPYQKVMGVGGFKALMKGRFFLYEKNAKDKSSLHYRVHDFSWGRREDVAYMYWSMIFSTGKGEQEVSFEGMSELFLSNNGKLLSHRDFWSRHEAFYVKGYKALKL
ncbi:MAG: hypothetical protein KAJ29_02105 [Alphaproteobacteria bacterium]|nr:hypothetical protein [Alphaproteobacteria bacterium]